MTKYAGRTVVLKRGDGATPTEVFTTVAQVSSIGQFGSNRDQLDVSTYGDEWKDFLGGQKEGDEMEIGVLFDPAEATHTSLQTDYDDSAQRNFRVESADAAYGWTISTRVVGFRMEAPLDGAITGTLTAKIVSPGVTGATIP